MRMLEIEGGRVLVTASVFERVPGIEDCEDPWVCCVHVKDHLKLEVAVEEGDDE